MGSVATEGVQAGADAQSSSLKSRDADLFCLLPEPIWHEVTSLLEQSDRENLRASCQKAREIVNSAVRTVQLYTNDGKLLGDLSSWRLHERFPNVNTIDFDGPEPTELTSEELTALAHYQLAHMTALSCLQVNRCTHFELNALMSVVASCPGLRRLTLPGKVSSLQGPALALLASLPNLQQLSLYNSQYLQQDALVHVATLTQLTSLNLLGCWQLCADKLCPVMDSLTGLQRLLLTMPSDGWCPESLTSLRRLTELCLDNCCLRDDDVEMLAGLPLLEWLSVLDVALDSPEVACLSRLSKLEVLPMTGVERQPKERPRRWHGFAKLLTAAPALRHVECLALNDDVLSLSLKTALQHLQIQSHTPSLLSGSCLMKLARLSALTSLGIYCPSTTFGDKELMALAAALATSLTKLYLGRCKSISDFGLSVSLRRLARLQALELEACPRLTDTSLLNAACHRRIKVIELWSCSGMSQEHAALIRQEAGRAQLAIHWNF